MSWRYSRGQQLVHFLVSIFSPSVWYLLLKLSVCGAQFLSSQSIVSVPYPEEHASFLSRTSQVFKPRNWFPWRSTPTASVLGRLLLAGLSHRTLSKLCMGSVPNETNQNQTKFPFFFCIPFQLGKVRFAVTYGHDSPRGGRESLPTPTSPLPVLPPWLCRSLFLSKNASDTRLPLFLSLHHPERSDILKAGALCAWRGRGGQEAFYSN